MRIPKMKRCPACCKVLDSSEFHRAQRSDGLYYCCKVCRKTRHPETGLSSKTRQAWHRICSRSLNADGNHPTYANIENRLDRREFEEWYGKGYFDGCSVDRIDNYGHYQMSNIALIPHGENSKKSSIHVNFWAPTNSRWCCVCREYLSIDLFYKNAAKNTVSKCVICYRKYQNNRNALITVVVEGVK